MFASSYLSVMGFCYTILVSELASDSHDSDPMCAPEVTSRQPLRISVGYSFMH